jgi:SAM-dependent methyltransferase
MSPHDSRVAAAFDAQAPLFEKAPVQTDPELLGWLVEAADLPPASRVLDLGCGPGLVSAALLAAGHHVLGIDLSGEMIERARSRGAPFGDRAAFRRQSLFEPVAEAPFDAAVSRFVLHHAVDPIAFVRRHLELVRPGGVVVLCDHTTDPDPAAAAWHQEVELARDHTHTLNLSPGALVDAMARSGAAAIRLEERAFALDFDEWFDRGTPRIDKEELRRRVLAGPGCRGFRPEPRGGGRLRIEGWLAVVRGLKPTAAA